MSTLRESVLRMVSEAFPALSYGYPRTYLVAAVRAAGGGQPLRLDLVPPPDAAHLAPLNAVTPWTIAGVVASPVVGSRVAVAFVDADKRRPIVLGFEPGTPVDAAVDASGTVAVGASASAVELAGGDVTLLAYTGRVVRYGDPILFGAPGQGTVSPGAVLTHFSKVQA